MDEKKLEVAADEFGLNIHRQTLQLSKLPERRMALMAAAPKVWGLNVWVDGPEIVLLDEKGFVCATHLNLLALKLCQFESTLGPGSVRALLSRPVIDPHAAVFLVETKRRVPAPPNVVIKDKGRPTVNPSVFADLLKEV